MFKKILEFRKVIILIKIKRTTLTSCNQTIKIYRMCACIGGAGASLIYPLRARK